MSSHRYGHFPGRMLDRQSGVSIRVYAVVKMSLTLRRIRHGVRSGGDDTTDILSTMLNFSETPIEKDVPRDWHTPH